jgi:hypothetical protein
VRRRGGLITVAEAAEASGINRRTLYRWIEERAKVDPTLLTKVTPGNANRPRGRWLINRASLATMLGMDVVDLEAALERHGAEIDSIKRDIRALKAQVRALETRVRNR